MSKPVVLVTRKWPDHVEQQLRQDYDVILNSDDHALSTAELQDAMRQADAVLPTVTDPISAEVIHVEGRRARILGNFGVGFNHIDIAAAKAAGIAVSNTPEVLTDCTADIAMLLLLMSARRGAEGDRHVRNQQWTGWRPTHMLGSKVTGKTLGLIGMGRIAQATARKAHHGFGMQIIYHDPFPPKAEAIAGLDATACATVEAVLQQADFVSIHCPGGADTHHLINAERLSLMKAKAHIINTARGDVIDPDALIAALKNNTIAGAGLDVFEGEPNVNPEFLTLDNISLLPHLGSATLETRIEMGIRVLENLNLFFAGKALRDPVV